MKTRTIKTLFVSAYCAALAALVLTPAHAAQDTIPPAIDRPAQYPAALAVIDVCGDDITARTCGGIAYRAHVDGCDLFPGDLIACIMDDAGTPDDIRDDVITSLRYAGHGDPASW